MYAKAVNKSALKRSNSGRTTAPGPHIPGLFPGMPEISSRFFGDPAPAAAEMSLDISSPLRGQMATPGANGMTAMTSQSNNMSYENADLDQITMRQLHEDIAAYNYDLDFCKQQLMTADLTPQETRTLQLRILDLGHQIRHCKHRIETMEVQRRLGSGSAYRVGTNGTPRAASSGIPSSASRAKTALPSSSTKRPLNGGPENGLNGHRSAKRPKLESSPDDDNDDIEETTEIRRLGMWNCRLCKTDKYKLAGEGRLPSAPCKWPLKDVSKMITHFTDMHVEHDPDERCMELGAALDRNRGPFEYWLRRSRSQKIGDGAVIDECIDELQDGRMPDILRRLSRAAADFPAN